MLPPAMCRPRPSSHVEGTFSERPWRDEQSILGFDAGIWIGLLALARTPEPIAETLSRAANIALKSEPVSNALKTQCADTLDGTPQAICDFIATDIERWTTVIRSAGLNN